MKGPDVLSKSYGTDKFTKINTSLKFLSPEYAHTIILLKLSLTYLRPTIHITFLSALLLVIIFKRTDTCLSEYNDFS